MSIDKSLRKKGSLVRARNVLKRFERIEKLKELDRWTEESAPFNLPKVRVQKMALRRVARRRKRRPRTPRVARRPPPKLLPPRVARSSHPDRLRIQNPRPVNACRGFFIGVRSMANVSSRDFGHADMPVVVRCRQMNPVR